MGRGPRPRLTLTRPDDRRCTCATVKFWPRLTLMSYPMIALSATLMMMTVLYYLARAARQLAGLKLTDMLNQTGDRP